MFERIKLRFADIDVTFADRDRAIKRFEEIGERGTYPVYVAYGPEGCGKTALLSQAKTILEDYGYAVVYFSPLEREIEKRLSISESVKEIAKPLLEVILGESGARFVDKVIELSSKLMKYRKKVAILADDIFQAVGLNEAESYVKTFLNMIEYPSAPIERIAIIVASSEGESKARIGRHSWSFMFGLWNMNIDGFRELYNQIPGEKPSFEDIWRLTGGNPRLLLQLYESKWNASTIIQGIISVRGLRSFIKSLDKTQKDVLVESLGDPDALLKRLGEAEEDDKPKIFKLINELIRLNLIMELPFRNDFLWIDLPPPKKDPELGIGEDYAWQTPLHREAVKLALGA